MTEIHCGCGASRLEEIMCADCGEYYRAGWIPVSERLPEETGYEKYLCLDKEYGRRVYGFTSPSFWWYPEDMEDRTGYVTHWMPLPEPPQEAE